MGSEQENIAFLQDIVPGIDRETAQRILRKHNGDLQIAASAALEGDLGEEVFAPPDDRVRPNTPVQTSIDGTLYKQKNTDIIDLTGDSEDADLSRALQLSMETSSTADTGSNVQFGPSNRAPDPNWALVPSNVPVGTNMSSLTQDDQSLSRAIEASLSTSNPGDLYEELPVEERIRQDRRPVALRTTHPASAYAGLLLQALFFVPQVRQRIAQWRPANWKTLRQAPAASEPESYPWQLLELFTYMDLTETSYINIDNLLVLLGAPSATSSSELPGELSDTCYLKITRWIETVFWQLGHSRLFHLRYAPVDLVRSEGGPAAVPTFINSIPSPSQITQNPSLIVPKESLMPRGDQDTSCIRVDIRGTEDTAELMSCLAHQFIEIEGWEVTPDGDTLTKRGRKRQQVIVQDSDVLAFHLVRYPSEEGYKDPTQPDALKSTPAIQFRYPQHLFLDLFLDDNAQVAWEKCSERKRALADVKLLEHKRKSLVSFHGQDTLAHIRSSVYYLENVAGNGLAPALEPRRSHLTSISQKLRKFLTRIENEIEAIDGEIALLKEKIVGLYDIPSMRQHRYDLRAVLVHDGFHGRTHMYSYIEQNGTWWKTLDHSVEEVPLETVLSDTAGLHLGAGPYMLIYSRACNETTDTKYTWPTDLINNCKTENLDFFNQLPSDLGTQLREKYKLSPPGSPRSIMNTITEETIPVTEDPARHLEQQRRRLSMMIGPREPIGRAKGPGRSMDTERKLSIDQEHALQKVSSVVNASGEDMDVDTKKF